MKNCYLPFAAALLLLFAGCDKSEPIPAYVDINSFAVPSFPDQKIDHAWVYANNSLLGAFPLPAHIPVLETGAVELQIFPGVAENGDYQTPNIYPILTKWVKTVQLASTETILVEPVSFYETASKMPLADDFDNGSRILVEDKDGDTATKIELTTDGGFQNTRSAKITLDTAHSVFEIYSLPVDDLKTNGTPTWLEIEYKTDVKFSIGLAASSPSVPETVQYSQSIFPKSTWSKMYINLTTLLQLSDLKTYKIALRAALPRDANNQFTLLNGSIWLDNIRFVHL